MRAPVQDPKAARRATLAAAPPAVALQSVTKTFRLPHQQFHTLKERMLHPLRSITYDELHALRDVDLTIPQGEFFGIVGRNGSGKSTMLKCLAGIYRPDGGTIDVHGRLSPFIELGVGFNPDLTAYDNVLINAVMLGLSRREARRAYDEIIEFSELREFVDLKLKNYSSGMAVRLGFATAVQVDADVLLVDEVLAVGDVAFQQKCFEQFQRMKDAGRTIVFVTHDMGAVERFCDRAMLIERGVVQGIGEPHAIAVAYNELNFGRLVHAGAKGGNRTGDQQVAEIADAWCEKDGKRIEQVSHGERFEIVVRVVVHGEIEDPVVGITMRNEAAHTLFVATNEWADRPLGALTAGDHLVVRFELEAILAQSNYRITPSLARAGTGADTLDLRENLVSLYIHTTRETGGTVDLPHQVRVVHL